MVTASLPLRQVKKDPPERTTIHLPKNLKAKAADIGMSRYGASLTRVIVALLQKEVSHRRGTLRTRLK